LSISARASASGSVGRAYHDDAFSLYPRQLAQEFAHHLPLALVFLRTAGPLRGDGVYLVEKDDTRLVLDGRVEHILYQVRRLADVLAQYVGRVYLYEAVV
jgi:hypothetical protein